MRKKKNFMRVQDLKLFWTGFASDWKKKKGIWELRTKMKTTGVSGERKEEDRLSDLSDEVLQHILEFLPTRQAIQTCVISKRWKNLWKGFTTLTFRSFNEIDKYNIYVSQVLSNRDHSISLHKMHLTVFNSTASKVFINAINYASLHDLHKLTLVIDSEVKQIPNSFGSLLLNCKCLTFLDIFDHFSSSSLTLPASFPLPFLKTLHLANVAFTAKGDNNYAEPFSECTSLITLVLKHSIHSHSTQTLCISNHNVSVLRMEKIIFQHTFIPKIVLSVPKLTSITLANIFFHMFYELSCICDLPLLNEVKIDIWIHVDSSINIHYIRVFSNVRTLTLSNRILNRMLTVTHFFFFFHCWILFRNISAKMF